MSNVIHDPNIFVACTFEFVLYKTISGNGKDDYFTGSIIVRKNCKSLRDKNSHFMKVRKNKKMKY